MRKRRALVVATGAGLLLTCGFVASRVQAQDPTPEQTTETALQAQLSVSDPICTFFGPDHDKFVPALRPSRARLTQLVASQLPPVTIRAAESFSSRALNTGSQTLSAAAITPKDVTGSSPQASVNTIDKYIFHALSDANVAPAPPTTDFEFIRRVTLDVTGRIPTADQVTSFVNNTSPTKRADLIETLLASPSWVDKWTIWFADLYKNNSRNTQIPRYIQGVMGFNDYIRTSLTNGKPYDQMAREIIAAQGTDSYTQGELNYLVGGVVGGGPIQDIFDQQTANTAETFLGISHLNCLLCHNGRGHLDALSLWGYSTSRQQAWGMASFMSHTFVTRTPVAGAVNNQPYYWGMADDTRYKVDYQLNTQTGNRPARGATNSKVTVPPTYIFDGTSPTAGQDYRQAL